MSAALSAESQLTLGTEEQTTRFAQLARKRTKLQSFITGENPKTSRAAMMSECELCGESENFCDKCSTCLDCIDREHEETVKEIKRLRAQVAELVQERDRLRDAGKYEGQLFKIATQDGDKFVPGAVVEQCPGLAVTMSGTGRFTITHISSGSRVCNGNYERFDSAILDMVKLSSIAHAHGFSWEEENPQDRIKEIADKPVPFDGATITDKDGTRPMTIKSFIQSLRPYMPFRDIDSPPWEDERPIDDAERILTAMNDDEEVTQ